MEQHNRLALWVLYTPACQYSITCSKTEIVVGDLKESPSMYSSDENCQLVEGVFYMTELGISFVLEGQK